MIKVPKKVLNYLHTDDNQRVWGLNGTGASYDRGLIRDFLHDRPGRGPSSFRILGTHNNATLLVGLYDQLRREEIDGLEVAGARSIGVDRNRLIKSPSDTLMRMATWEGTTASLGEWHRYDDNDQATYCIASAIAAHRHRDDDLTDVLELGRRHPVWSKMRCIGNIGELDTVGLSFAGLLADIGDPRFYVDRKWPNRNSRLESYLGITPRVLRDIVAEESDDIGLPDPIRVKRARAVICSWAGGSRPPLDDMDQPRNFLWRIWSKYEGGWKGSMRASQKFLSLLRSAWLSVLHRHPGRESLFVPEYFFSSEEEAAWYNEATNDECGV